MKLEGLTLETEESGTSVSCSLHGEGGILEIEGVVKDGRMVGTWSTFTEDGAVRTSLDLTSRAIEVELDADELCEELAAAFLEEWLLAFESPPKWMEEVGVLEVAWDDLDDESPAGTVAEFPFFLHGAFHPDPLVRELCLRSLHQGMVDDEEVFPAAAVAVPFLARMITEPGAPVLLAVRILLDLALSLEAGDDASDEAEKALTNALPLLDKALASARGKEAKALTTLRAHVTKRRG